MNKDKLDNKAFKPSKETNKVSKVSNKSTCLCKSYDHAIKLSKEKDITLDEAVKVLKDQCSGC